MAVSATNKERFLTEVQNNIDYCVRLLSSDTVDAEVTSNILARLQALGRDIDRTAGSLLSPEEKNDLMSIVTEMIGDVEKKIEHSTCSSENKSFMVNRPQLGQLGSPRFQITKEQLEFLNNYKFSAPLMADTLHTSESTIRRRLREFNIKLREGKQTEINDDDLDKQVKEVIGTNKRIGPNTIRVRLALENVNLSRQRVRDSCHRVDPVGCSLRSLERRNTQRRTYKVAGPNSLWHIDGNHKLIRWGVVIHGGIDGFSRLVTFLHGSNNNKSTTVFDLFTYATRNFGIPSRIRVDRGTENVDICIFMEGYRGENRGSAIKGKSSHNQRIERLWVDLWDSVSNEYYSLFSYMEESQLLDLTSALHMWAFQYVFIPRINKSLEMFQFQYNSHGLSTENSRTPYQIFIQGVLGNMHSGSVSISDLMLQAGDAEVLEGLGPNEYHDYGIDELGDYNEDDITDSDNSNLQTIHCPLNDQQMERLRAIVNPVENYKNLVHGVDIYKDVVAYLESVQQS